MHPIVLVANFSGNVGKTTLTKNLLLPGLPNARVFAVEDVNAGYQQGEAVQLSAEQTRELLEQVIAASFTQTVLVDVGASNVATFFNALAGYDQIHEFITKVVVPTESTEKVQTDTLSTLTFLVETLGVEPEKIALIYNKVPRRGNVAELFGNLAAKAAEQGVFPLGAIPHSDTFQIAAQLGATVPELAQRDPQELLAASRAVGESGGASQDSVRVLLAAASARTLDAQLRQVFANLGLR